MALFTGDAIFHINPQFQRLKVMKSECEEKWRCSGSTNEHLLVRVKDVIEALPYAGYRTIAWLLGENKNTIQRLFQLKHLQVRKRKSGACPRVEVIPSVASYPDERWATDMARVWCGPIQRWCALTIVVDCYTREVLGWRLSRTGNATAAEAALEEALIHRYGILGRVNSTISLRSDNGLVFTSQHYTKTVYEYGLKQEFIRPHTPQQNGMVERLICGIEIKSVTS